MREDLAVYQRNDVTLEQLGTVFRIHGLDQLDPPGETWTLCLFALPLREECGGEHSLPALVHECESRFGAVPASLSLFDNALAGVGYSALHEADYAGSRWRIVDERLFPTGPGFPRLGSEDFLYCLPAGVSELAYTLDLSGYTGLSFRDSAAAADLLR